MPKRDNADAASAPKRQKTMPAMQASKHVSDAPGWCSDPTKKMSAETIAALDLCTQSSTAHVKESDLPDADNNFNFVPVEGATGDRTLIQIADFHTVELAGRGPVELAKKIWMIEDAEAYMAKYGYAKHGKRLEAMHESMKSFNECNYTPGFDGGAFMDAGYDMTTVLLLGHNQPICRTNAIPALTKAGIVIQRREAPGAGEE
jgi:hypothetical protein